MRNVKKSIALFLSLIMCLGVLVACSKDSPSDTTASAVTQQESIQDTTAESLPESGDTSSPSQDSTSANEPETIPTNDTYTIKVENDTVNYCITRPKDLAAASPIIAKQQYLSAIIKDLIGVAAPLDTDWAKNEDPEKLEIIVGPTDHPETKLLLDKCSYGEYLVQAVGNKIVVLGYTEKAITAAANHLTSIFKAHRNSAEKSITLTPDEIYAHGSVDDQLSALPAYTDGIFLSYYDAGLSDVNKQCDEIIVQKTSIEKFNAYIDTMVSKNYAVYNTNETNNSKFVTLNNDKYTVNAGYYNYEKSVRIMIEPLAPAYPIGEKYNKVTSSNIILVGVEPKRGVLERCNGLSMIMRLEDGRFIVIDGGEDAKSLGGAKDSGSNPYCYDNINYFIELIKDQSKDYTPTPTIAAWFLTHDHGDHSHMLQYEYQMIKDAGIKVENIYTSALSSWELNNSEALNGGSRYQTIMETVAPALGAKMNRVHPGQVITIANCKIDILFTLESWTDGSSEVTTAIGYYNHSSIIFKTTFTDSATGKSTSVLNTGDGSSTGLQIAMRTFGEAALKCDIAVASHHGGGSGDDRLMNSIFSTIAAPVVLYPRGATDTSIANFTSRKASNVTIINLAKEVFYAGRSGQCTIIPVPYIYGTTQITSQTKLK